MCHVTRELVSEISIHGLIEITSLENRCIKIIIVDIYYDLPQVMMYISYPEHVTYYSACNLVLNHISNYISTAITKSTIYKYNDYISQPSMANLQIEFTEQNVEKYYIESNESLPEKFDGFINDKCDIICNFPEEPYYGLYGNPI